MNYNIFISHSWSYEQHYVKLREFINWSGIPWQDYSVPVDDPIHNANSDAALRKAIDNKIRNSSVVVIMAGVYSTYSKWINIELAISKDYGKPIIAVEPWASKYTSSVVKEAATVIVRWNRASIVNAITSSRR